MNLRALAEADLGQLKEIHEKYYKEEFCFPDFYNHCLGAFIIEEEGHVITAGCLKLTTEAILITNKDASAMNRVKALKKILDLNKFLAGKSGFPQIHAFIQDSKWEKQLLDNEFEICKGTSLVLNVGRKNG